MLPLSAQRSERGTSLAELMVALVVLSIGLLAVAQLFPAGSRGQVQDRMLTAASYYAQEKIEGFVNVPWDGGVRTGSYVCAQTERNATTTWRSSIPRSTT